VGAYVATGDAEIKIEFDSYIDNKPPLDNIEKLADTIF